MLLFVTDIHNNVDVHNKGITLMGKRFSLPDFKKKSFLLLIPFHTGVVIAFPAIVVAVQDGQHGVVFVI